MTNKPSNARSNSRHLDLGIFTSRRARLALLAVVGVGAFAGTSATAAQAGGFDIGTVPTTTVLIDMPIAQPLPQPDPKPDFPIVHPDPQPNPDFPIAQPEPQPDPQPDFPIVHPDSDPQPDPQPDPDRPIAQPDPDPLPDADLPIAHPSGHGDPTPDPDLPLAIPTPGETDPTEEADSGDAVGTHLPSTGAPSGLIAAVAAVLTALGVAATFTTRRRSA